MIKFTNHKRKRSPYVGDIRVTNVSSVRHYKPTREQWAAIYPLHVEAKATEAAMSGAYTFDIIWSPDGVAYLPLFRDPYRFVERMFA